MRRGIFIGLLPGLLLGFALYPLASPRLEHLAQRLGFGPPPPEPAGPPLPDRFFPTARMELRKIDSGLELSTRIESRPGGLAIEERASEDAYRLETSLHAAIPRAAIASSDLLCAQPGLDSFFPGWDSLLASAAVSPFYQSLYQRKLTFAGDRLHRFRDLPTRHNFFDCATILELTPRRGRPALLIQADMDVVTDGSDGDRSAPIDTASPYFQPFTAYNWRQRTRNPNPLLATYQQQLDAVLAKLAEPGLSETAASPLLDERNRLRQTVEALKYRSSLVASLDPFIVLPGFFRQYPGPHTPGLGDFAVVFHQNRAFPAIVGDWGPFSKIGEASLRIARAIDPELSGNRRPVSDLGATYLIFPGSADRTPGPPDLARWRRRCADLLQQCGGDPARLHDWNAPMPEMVQQ